MFTLTAEELELLSYVQALANNAPYTYDFRDPKQYAAAVMLTKKSFDTDRYPGKLEQLERLRRQHAQHGPAPLEPGDDSGWLDVVAVTDLGWTSLQPKIPAAEGIATVVGGYTNLNLTLLIQDLDTKALVTATNAQDPLGTIMPIKTDRPKATKATQLLATLMYAYDKNGASNSGIVPKMLTSGTVQVKADVQDPCRQSNNPLNPKAISIGLGRPWGDQGPGSRVDYSWDEPNQDHPIGKIPFTGSVTFPANIMTPLNSFLIPIISIGDLTSGGGARINEQSMDMDGFSIDSSNPMKLNWSFPPGRSATDPGNPLTFGNITWKSDMETCFYCELLVGLEGNRTGRTIIQSKLIGQNDPMDSTQQILNIMFVWHCLGEDSAVLMADGTQKPIAGILAGDKVRTDAAGGIGIVEWTNKGAHTGKLIRIAAANRKQITSTDNHVFLSPAGPITADQLKTGDRLRTADGETPYRQSCSWSPIRLPKKQTASCC